MRWKKLNRKIIYERVFLFCCSWMLCLNDIKAGLQEWKSIDLKCWNGFSFLQPTELRNLLFRMSSQKSMKCKFRYIFKGFMDPKGFKIFNKISKYETPKTQIKKYWVYQETQFKVDAFNIWWTIYFHHVDVPQNKDIQQTELEVL